MKVLVVALMSLGFLVFSCNPEQVVREESLITEVKISLDSAEFQKVYNFADRWEQDSLLSYLSHRDPSFRVLAPMVLQV